MNNQDFYLYMNQATQLYLDGLSNKNEVIINTITPTEALICLAVIIIPLIVTALLLLQIENDED